MNAAKVVVKKWRRRDYTFSFSLAKDLGLGIKMWPVTDRFSIVSFKTWSVPDRSLPCHVKGAPEFHLKSPLLP